MDQASSRRRGGASLGIGRGHAGLRSHGTRAVDHSARITGSGGIGSSACGTPPPPRRLTEQDPALLPDSLRLIDPGTRGDPESPLRWTTKSLTPWADALCEQGHRVSPTAVMRLLHAEGYSRQAPRKTLEGLAAHPDRDAQFRFIAEHTQTRQTTHLPVISVDAKKKELVGDCKNGGREWHPPGEPERRVSHGRCRSRYGTICRCHHSPLVAGAGLSAVCRRPRTLHCGGRRREQWLAGRTYSVNPAFND